MSLSGSVQSCPSVRKGKGRVELLAMSEPANPSLGRRRQGFVALLMATLVVAGVAALAIARSHGKEAPSIAGATSMPPLGATTGATSKPPLGATTANQSAALLFSAWERGDRDAASRVASSTVVRLLFAEPWSSQYQQPGGCFTPDSVILPPPEGRQPGDEVCNSELQEPSGLQFWTAPNGDGRYVVNALRVFHGDLICESTDSTDLSTCHTIVVSPYP